MVGRASRYYKQFKLILPQTSDSLLAVEKTARFQENVSNLKTSGFEKSSCVVMDSTVT